VIFKETRLKGAFLIEPERVFDERGFFARTFCQEEFRARGLNPSLAQCSLSFNQKRGTLRGLHRQAAPGEEAKLVRCTRGSIYDVIVDVRPGSSTSCQWFACRLSADSYTMLYVPEGFLHGFQTLEDSSEVSYQISVGHRPELSRGARWDDPAFGIDWPSEPAAISERDLSFEPFRPAGGGSR
jgi:dTDP-4-dehydrorhamnose 3,5-epimerase